MGLGREGERERERETRGRPYHTSRPLPSCDAGKGSRARSIEDRPMPVSVVGKIDEANRPAAGSYRRQHDTHHTLTLTHLYTHTPCAGAGCWLRCAHAHTHTHTHTRSHT